MRITGLLVTESRRTGAFITTLELLDALRQRGHEVTLNPKTSVDADVTITHVGDPRSRLVRGKHFMMVHGANLRVRRRLPRYDTVWFPSRSMERWYHQPDRAVVLPPAINPYDVLTTPGDHVTLSQTTAGKGSDRLLYFAQQLPHIPFLAVQASPPKRDLRLERLPNVTTVPRFEIVQEMFELTRLVIMPLGGMSWGRVAVEASVSGIPTIATGYAGIREAMGDAAAYVSVSRPKEWVEQIDHIYSHPEVYARWSAKAQARGDRIDYEADMARLCEAVEETA